MSKSLDEKIECAADFWREAKFPIALTGAGISVASGIPDFRSPGGLWERYDPGVVASISGLRNRPRQVWEFLLDLDKLAREARPTAAHKALAELEAAGKLRGVITQNIDNLHQRAGSGHVVEFHGTAARYYCMWCKKEFDSAHIRTLRKENLPWCCDECGKVIRPDFVFFGELIPGKATEESNRLVSKADLILIVGTSGEVAPCNMLPTRVASHGGVVIEINLGRTNFNNVTDLRFDAAADDVLPAIARLVLDN